MVKSTMTETVPSWGRGGTAAATVQNEQMTEQHSTLEQDTTNNMGKSLSLPQSVEMASDDIIWYEPGWILDLCDFWSVKILMDFTENFDS